MRAEAVDRVRCVFTLFDADGNGFIEADDFELMAGRVIEAVPGAADAKHGAMLSAFRAFWGSLETELDANRDGRIDFEEFKAVVLAPERFDEAIGEFSEALSTLADPDGDGLIERPVFVGVMTAIGFALPNIHSLFDGLEPTSTDQVAVSDWAESIRDYYRPDLAGILGDRLVGTPTG
ncbi:MULTISPECIES: EF-hand domain-containing protein [unclassified Streptomyces]|uniref:EF-hand domain-containing protein n=1 Tax=Streptomycetaceae TaxID=2062 RepID=UPI002E77D0FC|nr:MULTISPECIES: EF-hand domain-containing protein [unclassified Streptomyces]MED7951046.1 EF-hand domain-containing protein [Streptomyces sp. BE303]MEE1821511.1 EF-hand domain-containing protein [Streptomyces sp. BE20]